MKYLYTLYIWIIGLLLFVVVATLSLLGLAFVSPQKFSPVFKVLVRFLVKGMLIRVKTSGTAHLDKETTCIIMANHVSFLDVVLLAAYTPGYTIGIEDASHFSWPLFGPLIRRHGNLPINRKSPVQSVKTYELAKEKLQQPLHLVIFPEGGRSNNGSIRPFKKLPFRLAKEVGCNIVPLGLHGMYQMNNKNSWFFHPKKVELRFGPAIPANKIAELPIGELMILTREAIVHLAESKSI